MKNFQTSDQSIISLENNGQKIQFDLYSEQGLDLLSNLWIKVAAHYRLMYEPRWLGRPIIQFPTDIVGIQELIWEVKPDVIIETGVAHGGSLVLSASILEMIGKGKVVGVDIEIRKHNREAIENHMLSERIELIEGSSISKNTIEVVKQRINRFDKVLVMLDSNHTEEHVLHELNLYSQLVSKESYIVAHDGAQAWVSDIPNGKPEWKDSNPLGAIHKFLESNSDFIIENKFTRWGITSSPNGFLKRIG